MFFLPLVRDMYLALGEAPAGTFLGARLGSPLVGARRGTAVCTHNRSTCHLSSMRAEDTPSASGCVSAGRHTLRRVLAQNHSIAILPGGETEQLLACDDPATEDLVLPCTELAR